MFIGGQPELTDVFRETITLAAHWKTIGTLLRVPKHVLDRIKDDEEGANDRLQEMLSEWLKQTIPPPTWTALTDAIAIVNPSKAEELRKRCLDLLEPQ